MKKIKQFFSNIKLAREIAEEMLLDPSKSKKKSTPKKQVKRK